MASTSGAAGSRRITAASTTLCSDYQSLIIEIRKALSMIKGISVDLENQNKSDKVKQLDDAVLELLAASGQCAHFSLATQTVANQYVTPGDQLTDFDKVLEDEFNRIKAESPIDPQTNSFYRQFKEAIWNVHHSGQPMPGEEQEDIVMTSTQCSLLNMKCPLTGKPLTELESPVRCMECKHIYEKDPIMHYIKTKKPHPQCPVAGCPKILVAARIVCDPMLPIEIEEIRTMGDETIRGHPVEDCTELDDD